MLAQRPGTHYHAIYEIHFVHLTAFARTWKLFSSCFTSVHSILKALLGMHYTNPRSITTLTLALLHHLFNIMSLVQSTGPWTSDLKVASSIQSPMFTKLYKLVPAKINDALQVGSALRALRPTSLIFRNLPIFPGKEYYTLRSSINTQSMWKRQQLLVLPAQYVEQGLWNSTRSVHLSVLFAHCSSMWQVCCCGPSR